jgi:hypothetical protein
MDENLFTCDPDALYDLRVDTGATTVKVWFAEREIGLDMAFERLRPHELQDVLRTDREHAAATAKRRQEFGGFADLSPEEMAADEDNLPPMMPRAHASDDRVGALVMRWAERCCLDEDGRIPLLDIRDLRLYDRGKPKSLRDTVLPGAAAYNSFIACDRAVLL